MLSIIFSKKIYIFINRHARSSCVIISLTPRGIKEVSAPIRLSLLYLLYFFRKGGVQKRWKLALSVTAGIFVRRFDVEDQASQHIHFSDPLGGIMHKLPLLI